VIVLNRFLRNSPLYLLTCLVLFSSTCFAGKTIQVQAGTSIYDFIDHASEAQWSSGAGVLPFPGDPSDSRGFARYVYNALLEDGSTWSRVLETHPQWVAGGWIMGVYPQQTVPPNSQLTVRIGFLSGATGTDGAEFDVYFDEYRGVNVAPLRHTILSKVATLDGKLDLVTADLSPVAGKKGNFILRVYAGKTSNRDWAVWAEARIETKPLPDLVIIDVWESSGLIHYRVKNVGDAPTTPAGMPAKSFCNCLSIDGKQVAKHCITQVLQPGQEAEGVFDYAWQPTPGEHTVKVCADCEQNIEESNEGNNCIEEKWLKENLPDLVIDEIICNRNNSLIGYVLKNIGGEVAKGNHSTTLYVDGKEVAHDPVGVDLKPGDVFESWFKNYEWPECRNITVKVCADNFNQVKELDEGNNCLEKTCISYPVPIIIVSGPRAVNVTQDSVIVEWITNKNSDSTVVYSDRSTGEEKTIYDPSLVKNHAVKITGLKPRTTYRFYVGSKDRCGNAVISKTKVFETTPPPDTEKPSVTLFLPERLVGVVNISANASDNVGVEGVMFSIDGVVKFTDFSPPYTWVCDTTMFRNGVHDFDAIAFDAAGNRAVEVKNGTINNPMPDRTPPLVRIIKPSSERVHDLVEIKALIQDDSNATEPAGYIQRAEFYIDGVLVSESIYPAFHIDPFTREIIIEPARSNLTITHLWNATGLEPNSEHTIEVKAWDNSGNYGHDSMRVKIFQIQWIPPIVERIKIINIEVTRSVVRHDNWFDVSLTIRNTGNMALERFEIRDPCIGFQAMALPMPETSRDTSVTYNWIYHSSIVRITPLMERLNPGESWTFHYYAVPIVFDTMPQVEVASEHGRRRDFIEQQHIIGFSNDPTNFMTCVYFECEGVTYRRCFSLPYGMDNVDMDGNGKSELQDAFDTVDYLIVTHPERLFASNPSDEDGVNLLLQEIAVLAKIKHGVLGYLEFTDTPETLKSLLNPYTAAPSTIVYTTSRSAYKYDKLVRRLPAFQGRRNAYLLIVGETGIVPAKDVIGTIWGGERWNWDVVFCSDNYYADTIGCDGMPDLIVGRVVGENASELIKPISTSISVYLGLKELYLNVLAISGPEEDFPGSVQNIANELRDQGFNVDIVYTGDYSNSAQRAIAIKNYALDKSLIFWFGHGLAGGGSWASVLDAWEGSSCSIGVQRENGRVVGNPIDFGRSCPIVFAWSCETGRYVRKRWDSTTHAIWDSPLYGMPEAFFHYGAAVYMGSTMVMGGSPVDVKDSFFLSLKQYLENGYPIGLLFKDMKIRKMDVEFAFEFNYYGDPKYGG